MSGVPISVRDLTTRVCPRLMNFDLGRAGRPAAVFSVVVPPADAFEGAVRWSEALNRGPQLPFARGFGPARRPCAVVHAGSMPWAAARMPYCVRAPAVGPRRPVAVCEGHVAVHMPQSRRSSAGSHASGCRDLPVKCRGSERGSRPDAVRNRRSNAAVAGQMPYPHAGHMPHLPVGCRAHPPVQCRTPRQPNARPPVRCRASRARARLGGLGTTAVLAPQRCQAARMLQAAGDETTATRTPAERQGTPAEKNECSAASPRTLAKRRRSIPFSAGALRRSFWRLLAPNHIFATSARAQRERGNAPLPEPANRRAMQSDCEHKSRSVSSLRCGCCRSRAVRGMQV
jgi:hypothetical protein